MSRTLKHRTEKAAPAEEGVYYARDDYAGFARRVAILLVDMAVVLFLQFPLAMAFLVAGFYEGPFFAPIFPDSYWLTPVLLGWIYLGVLKPSRLRTVGYWAAGTRIVTLRGDRPSMFRMTFRLLLWVLGPFNLLIDLVWVAADEDSQTLRDRFAGTYVIRRHAQPIGRGSIHLAYYHLLTFTLAYPRVIHRAAHAAQPANAASFRP